MDPFDRLHPGVQYHLANTLRWNGLRPTQADAVDPILSGSDVLVLAPTAGGKTEAAAFPLLSAMAANEWDGISVLYVCPLRALLNNLTPRLQQYASWLGRSAAVWHGDTTQAQRQQILAKRPDILLTTPESLESMLVSTKVDARVMFSGLRAVVIDEIHAFAGDDRGWHLLAVLERLSRLAGREIQRIGLSATVGNPDHLLGWLQGSYIARPRRLVQPASDVVAATPDITVDYVGSLANAATIIARLHSGEKRLVFVDSRRKAEELGSALLAKGVTTFISHSSLSAAERRTAEAAFADARDTVIVATSTLELGIDIGDLDRVIQIDSPTSVASFLQRLGRTGRRSGGVRNCLFLCLSDESTLLCLGMLNRWSQGWIEPIVSPPHPRHIAAQQLMALCLQEHKIGTRTWREWWGNLPAFDDSHDEIAQFLEEAGFFERDGDFWQIGPEAERRFGRRYFSDLTAVFSAPPEFVVLAGRNEVGTIGTDVLTEEVSGPRLLLLGGRSWSVTHVDWQRRRCFVEPEKSGGRAKWSGAGQSLSFDIARGMREVLLGQLPAGVTLTSRAIKMVSEVRDGFADAVNLEYFVLLLPDGSSGRWWTWAGTATNRTLQASLPTIVDPRQRIDEKSIRLLPGLSIDDISGALRDVTWSEPFVDTNAVRGLKFAAALPPELAKQTLAARLGDIPHAQRVMSDSRRIVRTTSD
ncbi:MULTISPECIES: DEAD/DEAH box helicase [Actinomycetes]|uniref:DEAD/DEAH box helicase n=1 Tax=Actinomycetes TaxID=1760 RepID=UPI0004BEAA9B|nr:MULTISPECIES: DEAD/DEAH box helicase [Actinomycetes]